MNQRGFATAIAGACGGAWAMPIAGPATAQPETDSGDQAASVAPQDACRLAGSWIPQKGRGMTFEESLSKSERWLLWSMGQRIDDVQYMLSTISQQVNAMSDVLHTGITAIQGDLSRFTTILVQVVGELKSLHDAQAAAIKAEDLTAIQDIHAQFGEQLDELAAAAKAAAPPPSGGGTITAPPVTSV